MKLWPGWLVVMAAACGVGCASASTSTTPNRDTTAGSVASRTHVPNATIEHVVDGDTVDVTFDRDGGNERVRLIGIDTPETKKPGTPIECFGPEASAFTSALLPKGTRVLIVRDVEARDDYGRLLGYIYLGDDGTFVNLLIVEEGFARPLTIPPNVAFASQFVQAARDAEAADRGLWGGCSG